ncbi:hypothetical protein Aperf_G00000078747 [Anoplocephala perfoliata]
MTLRLKGSYSVSAAENPSRLLPIKPVTCNVIFLDDKSENFKLDKNARGQVLIDLVFDFLELLERDFFGLQFNDFSCNPDPLLVTTLLLSDAPHINFTLSNPTVFLAAVAGAYENFEKAVERQFNPYSLAPSQILRPRSSLVARRIHQVLGISSSPKRCAQRNPRRPNSHSGEAGWTLFTNGSELTTLAVPNQTVSFASSPLGNKCELGDYNSEECKQGYVNHIRLIPNQTPDFEAEAVEAHKSYRSYVPAAAELEYLQTARRLELYGLHPQEVTDRNRTKLSIGVSSQGLSVLREMRRIYLYTWDNVEKIAFSGKTFSVNLKHRPRSTSLLKSDPAFDTSISVLADKRPLNPTFFFSSAKRAKVFWQFAVTCHTFFRVREPSGISASNTFTFNAVNGGLQAPPISATTPRSSTTSSPFAFSKFFFRGSRVRRSMSLGTGGAGLERTMSTLMELRRRSKSIERGFFRGVSRRFTRRRSFAAPGRTQSVNILNAYESRDSLGMQSVPSLLDDSTQTPKNTSTDLESPSTSDGNAEALLGKSMDEQIKTDHPFSKKFRASAPALVRKQEFLPSYALNLKMNNKPNALDNPNGSPSHQKQATTTTEESDSEPELLSAVKEPLFPDQNSRKKRDTGAMVSSIKREERVLPRPTASYNDRSADQSDGKAKIASRTRQSIASKVTVEKAPSKPSNESEKCLVARRPHFLNIKKFCEPRELFNILCAFKICFQADNLDF